MFSLRPRRAAVLVLTLCLGAPLMSVQAAPKAQRTLAIAHRGASGYAPEHTFAAYDLALELGADYIEQDLQMTSDGVLVVMHDQDLDRTARGPAENCTGLVITKTLEQVKTCDMGSWFNEAHPELAKDEYVGQKIPTLEEVFQRYGKRVRYYIETKTPAAAPGMEEELLRLLDKYGLREPAVRKWQVLIQSFQPESLNKIHALDPGLPLIQLGVTSEPAGMEAIAEYAVGVGPSYGGVDGGYVDLAHSLCLDVHPYTVNDREDIQYLIDIGVDGMFSNYPDVVRESGGSGSWSGARAAALNRMCRRQSPDTEEGTEYQQYIGAMHEHSAYSDGYPGSRPLDYYESGESYGLDFMGGSDHSDSLGIPLVFNEECTSPGVTGCAIADDDNPIDSFRKWDATAEQAAQATTEDFTAFRGFEWTSDRLGHINVYFSENVANAKTDGGVATLESFLRWFLTAPDQGGGADGIATFNHPDGKKLTDDDPAKNWNDFAYIPSADYRFVGIETFNTKRNYDPWYIRALDKGWHVGAVGAEDLGHNRTDLWGAPEYAKTVILATDKSPESLERALLARRFYSVLDNSIRIEMAAGGEPMGSRLAREIGETVRISATVPGAGRLELVTNGGEVVASTTASALNYDATATDGEHYYFLRVLDGAGAPVAYSSPVWLTGGGSAE